MANHPSAVKRHRQGEKRRDRNAARRSQVRTAVRKLETAVETKDKNAPELLRKAVSAVMRGASRGVVHKRTASRKVARMSRSVHRANTKK